VAKETAKTRRGDSAVASGGSETVRAGDEASAGGPIVRAELLEDADAPAYFAIESPSRPIAPSFAEAIRLLGGRVPGPRRGQLSEALALVDTIPEPEGTEGAWEAVERGIAEARAFPGRES
jgi:hypothetical protein